MRILPFVLVPTAFVVGMLFQQARIDSSVQASKLNCELDKQIAKDECKHVQRALQGCEAVSTQCLKDVSEAEGLFIACMTRLEEQSNRR
jgi:hypothetical protein